MSWRYLVEYALLLFGGGRLEPLLYETRPMLITAEFHHEAEDIL